jgi:hypothetical protein
MVAAVNRWISIASGYGTAGIWKTALGNLPTTEMAHFEPLTN